MSSPSIEAFGSTISIADRQLAISNARVSRKNFQLNIWRQELPKLPKDIRRRQGWGNDMNSWKDYLQYCYQKDAGIRAEWRKTDTVYGKELTYGEWETGFLFNTLDMVVVTNLVTRQGGEIAHLGRSLYGNHFQTSGDEEFGPLWIGDYWNDKRSTVQTI